MEYKDIINKIRDNINYDDFFNYLENMITKIKENNGFSKNMDNIYGFYISFNECISILISESGNLELHCEQNVDNSIRKKSVLYENSENGIFSIKYYIADIDSQQLVQNSIFETLVFNEEHKLVHARYEKDGNSITIPTNELEKYSSFFYQDTFQKENKKI